MRDFCKKRRAMQLRALVILGALALAGCSEPDPSADRRALPDRIVLTYADDPATTQSVTWRMPLGADAGVAQVAPASGAPNLPAGAQVYRAPPEPTELQGSYHSVTFTDLSPGTRYAYRVGDGQRWSAWFQFTTAAASAEPFAFIYLGDAQNGVRSYWGRTVLEAARATPEARFVVHSGDLIDHADADAEWADWFGAAPGVWATLPSLPAVGNHEYGASGLSLHWRPQFALPEPQGLPESLAETVYSIDYQGVRLIVLNSMDEIERQVVWLEQQLAAGAPRWTIVAFHHPVFASRPGTDYPRIRSAFLPLFDRYSVDLVLQGHEHNYARGHTEAPAEPGETRSVKTAFVTSVSGPKMYAIEGSRWSAYESMGVRLVRSGENTQLFQVVRIDGDSLHFEAYTAAGELYDAFTLVEAEDGSKQLTNPGVVSEPEYRCENTPPYDVAFESTIWPERRDTEFKACTSASTH